MSAIVLDTETTGLDKETDRVVELGIIDFTDGRELMLQRFNPERSIPLEVTAIHGISDDDVADCPKFESWAETVKTVIEQADAVIGYHIFYDFDMLSSEFARLKMDVKWPPLVCAKRVWDVYEPREERHLRNAFMRFVDRKGFENAHSALADIQATRDVLIAQIAAFGLEKVSWDQMDPERRFWWGPSPHILLSHTGELKVNFGKHRGKHVHEVDTGFWRWISSKDFPDHILLLSLEMINMDRDSSEEKKQKILNWAIRHKEQKSSGWYM